MEISGKLFKQNFPPNDSSEVFSIKHLNIQAFCDCVWNWWLIRGLLKQTVNSFNSDELVIN